jgi:hypothetical protein
MPERWLDRSDRTFALATCLQCPIRQWCAQEALRVRACWGMWAGIWIDGRLSPVAPHLRAIAAEPSNGRLAMIEPLPIVEAADVRRPLPRRRRSPRFLSVRAAVLARCSGHCEILGDRCALSAEAHVSRVKGLPAERMSSATAVFAVCRACAVTLSNAVDPPQARRLGFEVDSVSQARGTPFFWRSCRWVWFGEMGQLEDVGGTVDAARAS